MGVRAGSLGRAEIGRLSAEDLGLFASRVAQRVRPWCPPALLSEWDALSVGLMSPPAGAPSSTRRLTSSAAAAANALARLGDETLGRCANHACDALALLTEAIAADKATHVLAGCRAAASVPAVLAHAGRAGGLTADEAALGLATALRNDLAAPGASGPLWPDGQPAWASPTDHDVRLLSTPEVTLAVRREQER